MAFLPGTDALSRIAIQRPGQTTAAIPGKCPATGLNPIYYENLPKAVAPKLPVAERTFDTEIEGDIGRTTALAEAERCLSCGNCLACDNCWTFCPDNAVIKTAELATDGSHYLFDLDYCKGCGLCAHECPTGYIQMQPE